MTAMKSGLDEAPRRLRLQRRPETIADASPTRTPAAIAAYPIPDVARQHEAYAQMLPLLEARLPGPSARLRDDLQRIVAAHVAFQRTQKEERERVEAINEDIRDAEKAIDDQIASLREAEATLDAEFEPKIQTAIEARDQARRLEAINRTLSGESIAAAVSIFAEAEGDAAASVHSKDADAAPTPEPATASAPPTPRLEETESLLPARLAAPFPIDQVRPRAKCRATIALEQGLPSAWVSVREKDSPLSVALQALSTVVCGGLFGLSLGVLFNMVHPTRLMKRPDMEWGGALICAIIGLFVFVLIGQSVKLLAGFAGEGAAAAMLARTPDRREWTGVWMKRIALGAAIALSLAVGVLVSIEASVERQGLVRAFLESGANRAIATGQHVADAASGPSVWATVAIVLAVVVPYVLAHLCRGWIRGWTGAIQRWLDIAHESEVHAEARRLHEAHEEALRPHNELLQQIGLDRLRQRAESSGSVATPACEPLASEASQTHLPSAAPDSGSAAEAIGWEAPYVTLESNGAIGVRGEARWAMGSREAVALSATATAEAEYQLRRLYARRNDRAQPLREAIERWEAERRREQEDLDDPARERIQAAFTRLVEASQRFEKNFERCRRRYERITGKTLGATLYRAVVDNPEPAPSPSLAPSQG